MNGKAILTQLHIQGYRLGIHHLVSVQDTSLAKHAGLCRFAGKQRFGIVRHRTNCCIRSIVTFPICTVLVVVDDFVDLSGFGSDSDYD